MFPKPDSEGGRALADVAANHGATPRQVALRFLVRDDGVYAIPKASNIAHVEDNAGALELALTPSDIEQLDAAFELGPPLSGLPFL
jgi:diketogulonate reductase-like aldo/keto reductase